MSTAKDTAAEIKRLHQQARALLKAGKSEAEVVNALCNEGIEASYATMIIENVQAGKAGKANFWKMLAAGVFVLLAGIIINIISYKTSTGAFFLLVWGVPLAGLLVIIRALILYRAS
jgi:cytochrome c-type biogenesis protein CcmH/NrfF